MANCLVGSPVAFFAISVVILANCLVPVLLNWRLTTHSLVCVSRPDSALLISVPLTAAGASRYLV